MSAPIKLITKSDEVRNDAIECVRNVLSQLESGEAISVCGIVETNDGCYRPFGSSTMSRLQTAGALLECAVERLK